MPTIYDLTSTEIAAIQAAVAAGIPTQGDISAAMNQVTGANVAPPNWITVTLNTGILYVSRRERITYVKVDTQGGIGLDTMTGISGIAPYSFNDGDTVVIQQVVPARVVSVQSNNSIVLAGAQTRSLADGFMTLQYIGGTWREYNIGASDSIQPKSIILNPDQTMYIASGVIAISEPAYSYIEVASEQTGEVLATGTIQISVTGSAGTLRAWVDLGFGGIVIGEYAYAGSEPESDIATNLKNAINAGTTEHGFTATSLGDTVTIECPAGSGATGNSYILSDANTGGATIVTTSFAGGSDGADQDDELDSITGGLSGQIIVLKNVMTANNIKLTTAGNFNLANEILLIPGAIITLRVRPDGLIDRISESHPVVYLHYMQASTFNPVDGQTLYFGMAPTAPTTTANIRATRIASYGRITKAYFDLDAGTAGSADNWSMYIRKNNTTDYLIQTVGVSSTNRQFQNAALDIPVIPGDTVEIKLVNPTWSTNPANAVIGGYLYIQN